LAFCFIVVNKKKFKSCADEWVAVGIGNSLRNFSFIFYFWEYCCFSSCCWLFGISQSVNQ